MFFFFQAEDGIRDVAVTGVQTCALPISISPEVEALLIKRFGDKKSCPHGVPMRGGIATLRKQGAVLLGDLRPKDSGEILCVYEKDAQFLEFLEGLHLRPSPSDANQIGRAHV